MDRLLTQELETILSQAKDLPPVLDRLDADMNAPTFPVYLARLMEERGISPQQLSELSLLSRSFTYQLCSGTRAPSREIVLRLAIVLGLEVEEAQRLLRVAQRGALYPRVRRDAILIFCLSHRCGLYDADDLLTCHDELPLL